MKKYYFLLLTLAVVLLTSCSKVPNYAKVIPDDAILVVRVDARQLAEKSGVGENEKVKKKVRELLKDGDMRRGMREKLEAILDDPQSTGIDLTQPMFFYAAQDGDRVKAGFVGGMRSKDDLTELLNALAKEIDRDKVNEEKNYNYFAVGSECLVFTDDWFYFGEKRWREEAEDWADDIYNRFSKDSKNSIIDNDDFQKMCSADGVAQMLISGKGLSSIRDFRRLSRMLPDDLDLEDISCLLDLTIEKGEIALTCEALTHSDKWGEWIKHFDALTGDIKGDLLKYISKDGSAFFCNIDGEACYEELKEFGILKELDHDERDMVKKFLCSINGDAAFGMTDFGTTNGYPTMALYVETKDNQIVNQFVQRGDNNLEQRAANQYRFPIAYNYRDYNEFKQNNEKPTAYCDFGYKNNTSYMLTADDPEPFRSPSNAFTKDDLKGKKMYSYFSFAMLKPLTDKFYRSGEKMFIEGLVKICDFYEFYTEGGGKAVLRLVTKDKDTTPLAALISYGFDIFEEMQNAPVVEDDYSWEENAPAEAAEEAWADSAVVEEPVEVDSVAAW